MILSSPTASGTTIHSAGAAPAWRELHMSVATVKAHVYRLLGKLEAENRVQVALLVQDSLG